MDATPHIDETDSAPRSDIDRELELLAELGEVVVQRELELTELLQRARTFRSRYLAIVGAPQAQLDQTRARFMQLRATLMPDDETLAAEVARALADAEQATRAVREARRQMEGNAALADDDLDGDGEVDGDIEGGLRRHIISEHVRKRLRSLYRAIARRVHPDLALGDDARAVRTEVMQDVIEAYQAGDLRRLEMMAEAYVERDGGGTRLDEVAPIRQRIVRLRLRLETLDAQIAEVHDDFLHHLAKRAQIAESEGRDLLAEIAEEVTARADTAQLELDALLEQGSDVK